MSTTREPLASPWRRRFFRSDEWHTCDGRDDPRCRRCQADRRRQAADELTRMRYEEGL